MVDRVVGHLDAWAWPVSDHGKRASVVGWRQRREVHGVDLDRALGELGRRLGQHLDVGLTMTAGVPLDELRDASTEIEYHDWA